ncbi:hypothetical protein MMUR_27870 [Mycolicibacterium murale]|jgi:hypothetical protein|uniref:DUF4185 domain-containing protein n=1 Tax=Mycolicibacterium murale TaxID=182220 RepID=A0A7I9WLN3_9MYCO|nr:DUF4185 domain-containing protein [Mycolicibacterium murale]MCV7181246.1 DUF4185 domain-containing protein [Mycolicibacterium murale]GFG58651.1 hypothetical protein MMUR_27870 [Mycolicibacterium murale]
MTPTTRLVSITAASALVAALAIPAVVVAPAAADPCSVSPPSASTRGLAPSALPKLPVLHVPIGRKPGAVANPNNLTPAQADGAVAPETTARAAAAPAAATATRVQWLTGPETDSYKRFGISGTDLGITWDNGSATDPQVLIAFGDTFGNCAVQDQEWRKNVLYRSADRNLADGMRIPDPKFGDIYAGSPVAQQRPDFSRQVIASLGVSATEVTVIPTAGISVGNRQYVNFMSVSQWGNPGQWSTNFSAVAVSDDNGETWTVPRSGIRPSWFNTVPGVPFVWGFQNFQMAAYVRSGGFVYAYGTGAGRGGMPFLSRVPENKVADNSAYEYFTPFGWIRNTPYLALQVVWAPGSEMSVAYNEHLKKFVMLYTNTLNNVVMRTADKPEGPWSQAKTIVTTAQVPGGIYAPYIHPWSSGSDLYFTLSVWDTYSVMLMRTTLN